jgi:lysyl-tRNA synthetase class II
MESLTSIEQSRIEKLHALAKSGIVCFPERFAQSATIEQVRQSVETLIPTSIADLKEGEHKNQALAGRIMAIRRHGNIMFLDIRGQSGTIQVAIQNS